MPSDRKIELPKKVTGNEPGLVKPEDWNQMITSMEALMGMLLDNILRPGADIGIRKSPGGVVAFLKRRIASQAASPGIAHQWKTTDGGLSESEEPLQQWNVKSGSIWDHIPSEVSEEVESYVPIIVPDSVVLLDVGIIYLEVQRDLETRKVTDWAFGGAVGTIDEETGLLADYNILPANESGYQYFPIAIVGTNPKVIQLQFQEIKLFEMLIVSNGSLKFGNFQLMGLTNYDVAEPEPEP